jgi:hypothetical protein
MRKPTQMSSTKLFLFNRITLPLPTHRYYRPSLAPLTVSTKTSPSHSSQHSCHHHRRRPFHSLFPPLLPRVHAAVTAARYLSHTTVAAPSSHRTNPLYASQPRIDFDLRSRPRARTAADAHCPIQRPVPSHFHCTALIVIINLRRRLHNLCGHDSAKPSHPHQLLSG